MRRKPCRSENRAPPPEADRPAHRDNRQPEADPSRQQPKPGCLSFQSSFSSTTAASSGRPRPLGADVSCRIAVPDSLPLSHIFSRYLWLVSNSSGRCIPIFFLPHEINGLDNEAQGWADGGDILAHDLLDDGCFAGIVKAPAHC